MSASPQSISQLNDTVHPITIQINDILLINPLYYSSTQEDIESLCHANDTRHLCRAAEKCEKFHSYFHYEESFFYTILSNFVSMPQKQVYLEKAIQLSPINKTALIMLQQIDQNRTQEIELKLSYIKTASSDLARPYDNFAQYIKFATQNSRLQNIDLEMQENYWNLYEKFKHVQNIEILQNAMSDLQKRHTMYHTEAAKIYYALFLSAQNSKMDDLAKFAIIKATNLDPTIKTKAKHA